MSKTYIADKDPLDAVNGKIGTKDDVPSPNPISLFAGIKQLLKGLSDHMATWTGDRAAKVDYLDTTVGSRAPANTALSTAQWTNARAGYLDKLNSGVEVASLNGKLIKSIQRGVLTWTSGGENETRTVQNVTISSVDLKKAMVIKTGEMANLMNNGALLVSMNLFDSKTLKIEINAGYWNNQHKIPWQVVEFY